MKVLHPRTTLPFVALVVFITSFSAYVILRIGISDALFGGDTVNISSHHPSSFTVNKLNVDLPAMAKAIYSGKDDTSANNPHSFVYNQLSEQGRLALSLFVKDFQDSRSETAFLLAFDRGLIAQQVSWPNAFQGPPLVKGRGLHNHDLRGKNLLALAAVYPIRLPVNQVAYAFKQGGGWQGIVALKPFIQSMFTLTQATRYTPLTNTYVVAVQSYLGGRPDQVIIVVMITGILFALLALTVFLLAEIVIGSIPWALTATTMTLLATSTIAASVTLFSLPYLFVPIVMGMAFYAYLKFKQTGAPAWLLLVSLCALIGPWFREFAAVIPFIILACEIMTTAARRSWLVIILCFIFIGHSVYPSFITWVLGINNGIVTGVFQQANTQAQMSGANPGNLGILFVQFPPSFWLLAIFAILWWLWRRLGPNPSKQDFISLPGWIQRFSIPNFSSLSGRARLIIITLFLLTALAFIKAFFISGSSVPFPMIRLDKIWGLSIIFFVLIGLFSFRFGALPPIYFAATFMPFLWIRLAEVHMAFTLPPLAIILTLWIRELFQGLTKAELQKTKLAAVLLLALAIGDQGLNYQASLSVQQRLVVANQALADWITKQTDRNSIVISNFYNYTDVYYYSGNYFDPFESVENNPLGPTRTVHHDKQMQDLLADNWTLRDIYFLQGDHDFFDWQRGYHSHKWVNNPPGKIRKLKEFPVKAYYYYIDPLKYFIPRNFVSFLGYMDWSTDYYFDNDKLPFRRLVDVTYRIFKLESYDKDDAWDKEPQAKFAPSPVLLKSSVGPTKNFNLVHYQQHFYAVPQLLGAVDWKSGKVGAMKGVIVATTRAQVMAKLNNVTLPFTTLPILLEESIGADTDFNLIHYQERFYGVPQSLGAVDWESGKVATMKGVIVAATAKKVKARLAEIKPTSTSSLVVWRKRFIRWWHSL